MALTEEQLDAWGRHFDAKIALHGTDFWTWWARNGHLYSQASSRSQTPTGLLTPTHDDHGIVQPIRFDAPRPQRLNLASSPNSPHMLTPDREIPELYEEPGEQIATPNLDGGLDSEDGGPADDTPDRILRSQGFRYRYFFELRWNGRRATPAPIPGCEEDLGPLDEHTSREARSKTLKSHPRSIITSRSNPRRSIPSQASGITKSKTPKKKRKWRARNEI